MFLDWEFWFALCGIMSTGVVLIFKAGGLSKQLRDTTETVENHDVRICILEKDILTINIIKGDVAEIKHVQKAADEKREESREAYIAEITEIKTCLKYIKRELESGKSSTT